MLQPTNLMSAVMGLLVSGLHRAHSWTCLPKWTPSDKQMCKCFLFSFSFPQKSADRELSGRVETSTVCVMSPAYIVLHIPPILAWIFIVYHVFICVCLCVCEWESDCGSKSPAGVWGKKQQEAENPCCLWINVSKHEARQWLLKSVSLDYFVSVFYWSGFGMPNPLI